METATELIEAWANNGNAQAELRAFLGGTSGRAALALLKELNRPVQLPQLVAGIDPDKAEAGRLNQAIGWNRCLDQLVAMCHIAPLPQDTLQPWAHYGETNQSENREQT